MTSSPDQKIYELVIFINGRKYQPPKKIVNKKDLLELAKTDESTDVYLITEGSKEKINSEEGVELQAGMRFLIA
jgi:hypothetical protein